MHMRTLAAPHVNPASCSIRPDHARRTEHSETGGRISVVCRCSTSRRHPHPLRCQSLAHSASRASSSSPPPAAPAGQVQWQSTCAGSPRALRLAAAPQAAGRGHAMPLLAPIWKVVQRVEVAVHVAPDNRFHALKLVGVLRGRIVGWAEGSWFAGLVRAHGRLPRPFSITLSR